MGDPRAWKKEAGYRLAIAFRCQETEAFLLLPVHEEESVYSVPDKAEACQALSKAPEKGCQARLGGWLGGEWVHVLVWLSPLAVHGKLSQHCCVFVSLAVPGCNCGVWDRVS